MLFGAIFLLFQGFGGSARIKIRESFCESGEGVRLPRERGCLRGSPETSGEVRGTSGEVWETSGEPLDCC